MKVEKQLIKGIKLLREGKEEGFNILYSHTYNFVFGQYVGTLSCAIFTIVNLIAIIRLDVLKDKK